MHPKNMFLQVSGLKIKVNLKSSKVEVLEINNSPFVPEKKYILCTDDFIAKGGDGMIALKEHHTKYDTGLMVHDGLIDFIKDKKTINYGLEGRIIQEN